MSVIHNGLSLIVATVICHNNPSAIVYKLNILLPLCDIDIVRSNILFELFGCLIKFIKFLPKIHITHAHIHTYSKYYILFAGYCERVREMDARTFSRQLSSSHRMLLFACIIIYLYDYSLATQQRWIVWNQCHEHII